MSQSISQAQCAPPQDPPENVIMHLYHTAAAMEPLAGTLPEKQDGLPNFLASWERSTSPHIILSFFGGPTRIPH